MGLKMHVTHGFPIVISTNHNRHYPARQARWGLAWTSFNRQHFCSWCKSTRPAIATLELVLAMPIILVVFVGIVWLGFSVIGQSEVTTEARHAAWAKRFDRWQASKFDFTADDSGTGEAKRKVSVTPILTSEQGPHAKQQLAKGPWDHRLVAFDQLPNWQLYAEMGIAAKTVNLKFAYDDAQSLVGQLQQLGSNELGTALAEFAAGLHNPSSLVDSQVDAGKNRAELDQQLDRNKAQGQVDDLQRQIQQLRAQLDEVNDSDEESAEDKTWLIEQQIKRVEIELKLARDLAHSLETPS